MPDKLFLQVILPLRLDWEPWYYATGEAIAVGERVSVIFAGRKYTTVVERTAASASIPESKVRSIVRREEHLERISPEEIRLWRFISTYYLCSIGEVYRQAYPAGRIEKELVKAKAQERAMEKRQEAIHKLEAKLQRLHSRLSAKELALQGRHSEKVTSELIAAKASIESEIAAAENELASVREGEEPFGQYGFEAYSEEKAHRQDAGDRLRDNNAEQVEEALAARKPVLLTGGAAAREIVYRQLAGEALADGRSALWLVPEIILTEQLEDALRSQFGERFLLFHSGSSLAARRGMAQQLREGGPYLVLATRSAVFLPFQELGLVIIDNEHDPSYKQDSAPRFHTRDLALVLAQMHGADAILGSATPSLESIYNCLNNKYLRIALDAGSLTSSEARVVIIDTAAERRKKGMLGSISRKLAELIRETLENGWKVLLLRSWGRVDFVEEDVRKLFSDRQIERLDKENRSSFNEGADIFISTMFVTKNLEIPGLGLVAVLQSDRLLGQDDFRADERALQLLELFRSRPGGDHCERGGGLFVIQTEQAGHPVYRQLQADGGAWSGDDFRLQLLAERQKFGLPPFTRMINLTLRDRDEARLERLASNLAGKLSSALQTASQTSANARDNARQNGGDLLPSAARILGPYPPGFESNPGAFTRIISVTLPRDNSLNVRKLALAKAVRQFEKDRNYSSHISIDVDPA